MRREKSTINPNDVWNLQKSVNVIKNDKDYYFEIGDMITSDISEAVAIMMRFENWSDDVWNTKIEKDNLYNTKPENALYWMSGGDEEWMIENNYNKSWSECYLEYQEEFGLKIMNILEKSETLSDVRKGFMKHINLHILYEFALRRGIA